VVDISFLYVNLQTEKNNKQVSTRDHCLSKDRLRP